MKNDLSKRVRLHPTAAAERMVICTSVVPRAGQRGWDNTSRSLMHRVEAGRQWHDYPRDMGKDKKNRKYKKSRKHQTNRKHRKGPHLVIPGDGDPCPRCGRPMQIREHPQITAKHRRQPFHYSRWFCCIHDDCKTSTVMPRRYVVWHCSGEKRQYLEARYLGIGLSARTGEGSR
jgi:hypothetical protein